MAINPDCWDLAVKFLEPHPHIDTEDNADDVAAFIQYAIENYIKIKLDNYEPKETGDAWGGGFAPNH